MAKQTFIHPIESLTGKLTSSKNAETVLVNRRKCFGKTPKGETIYGPNEVYMYTLHKGDWSENVTRSRQRFSEAQKQAREELADPEKRAYWQQQFDFKNKHPQHNADASAPQPKRYSTLLGYVVAQILKRS